MSTQRGIFENFPSQSPSSGSSPASPFGIAPDKPAHEPSPFTPAAKKPSPFSVVGNEQSPDDHATIRLPERRKPADKPAESPFHISEPHGFGYEAQQQSPQSARTSPFEPAPSSPAALQASPFQQSAASPGAFGGWPQPEVAPSSPPQPFPGILQPAAAASDSYSIKQLELRAIFGVDREMTNDEIIHRARSLPGIRQVARVSDSDMEVVDAFKRVIANLGFGSNPIKLYSGSVPIEFIREGKTLLAVQTDGGFAPGVRETLMLVARELGK